MSVLIKGMNKPKSCLMCQFHGFGGYKNELIVCSLTGRSEGQLSNVPDCPLVEVPTPHGRLIDTDKLINTLQGLFDKREEEARFTGNREVPVTWNDAIYFIKIASTIIEAEDGATDINVPDKNVGKIETEEGSEE